MKQEDSNSSLMQYGGLRQSIFTGIGREQSRVVRLPLNIVQPKRGKDCKKNNQASLNKQMKRAPKRFLKLPKQLDMSVYEVQETLKNSGGTRFQWMLLLFNGERYKAYRFIMPE